MDFEQFKKIIEENLQMVGMEIDEKRANRLYQFMNILVEENKKVNLTSITEPKEIILKHFVDSLTINPYIKEESKIIDVGTGAGFPGIPIAIYRNLIKVYLLDSLNKRIEFIKKVIRTNNLENVETIWGRAEDIAQIKEYRENFDVAVSRAVAPLNILLEYLLPFVKIGGICICMKGPNYQEEMANIEGVLSILGGKVELIKEVQIEGIYRSIIIIKKTKETDNKYPRKAGIPSKKPLK